MKVSVKNETPEEKFKRIAETRANAILDKLRLLGNCANKHVYRYDDKDVEKIFLVIRKQLKATRAKFDTRRTSRFKL